MSTRKDLNLAHLPQRRVSLQEFQHFEFTSQRGDSRGGLSLHFTILL